MISGYATPAGTAEFAAKHPSLHYRPLGKTKWLVAPVGFGTYRVDDENPAHATSLAHAIEGGLNLIDTSTNYTDGRSERLVGNVVGEMVSSGKIKRDNLVVVSKVGYVQGQNLVWAHEREKSGSPIPEMVKYQNGCWHCLHPEFIEAQLTRSLERLKLTCLDVYLLHNPEYFLSDAKKRPYDSERIQSEFYDRIGRAFAHLESEVAMGRIRAYGVSSNTFGSPEAELESTSVSVMWNLSRDLSDDPKFRVLQMPLNLFESGPVLELKHSSSDDAGQTALRFAKDHGLGVLVNRPLNAFSRGHMFRLADFPIPDTAPRSADEPLRQVQSLESEFAGTFAPQIQMADGSVPASELLQWGIHLDNLEEEPLGRLQWDEMEKQIAEQSNYVLRQLDRKFAPQPEWLDWAARYSKALGQLLEALRARSSEESQRLSNSISAVLTPYLPPEIQKLGFAAKAMAVLANTNGVTCVLNGMRKPRYVAEAMTTSQLPGFQVADKLYGLFQQGATLENA